MDNISYKNVKRGTRRHYTKKYDKYEKRTAYVFEKFGLSAYVKEHKITRGYKFGRCDCYNEYRKGECDDCERWARWKAGELSLDDDLKDWEETQNSQSFDFPYFND